VPNTEYAYIIAGNVCARAVNYTVPAGKSLYVAAYQAGLGAAITAAARYVLKARYNRVNKFLSYNIFEPMIEGIGTSSNSIVYLPGPFVFPAGCDIKASATGFSGFNGAVSLMVYGWTVLN
jgi:hypothetical protein